MRRCAEALGVSTEEPLGLTASLETLPTIDLKIRLQTLLRQEALLTEGLRAVKREMAALMEERTEIEADLSMQVSGP